MSKRKAKKEAKKRRDMMTGYIVGGVIVGIGAIIIIPRVVEKLSSVIYSKCYANYAPQAPEPLSDDWGPVIVKKEDMEKGEAEDGELQSC